MEGAGGWLAGFPQALPSCAALRCGASWSKAVLCGAVNAEASKPSTHAASWWCGLAAPTCDLIPATCYLLLRVVLQASIRKLEDQLRVAKGERPANPAFGKASENIK